MIEPMISENGQSRARCVCDECGAVQVIAVHFKRHRGGTNVRHVNEGTAHKKLSHLGWDVRRGTVCPDCVARKKAAAAQKPHPNHRRTPRPWKP